RRDIKCLSARNRHCTRVDGAEVLRSPGLTHAGASEYLSPGHSNDRIKTMAEALAQLGEFSDILKEKDPLAPFTLLEIRGPADLLAQPRTLAELTALVARCAQKHIPLRVLGGGSNILVRDEGIQGVVIRLGADPFTQLAIEGSIIRVGAGATLAALIAHAVRN